VFGVGVRLLEAIELQWERENGLERERESGTESKANSHHSLSLLRDACAGLFIGEVKGLITMP
jgi:4-hydroxy-L-threonine phosphate dehydrogenase PdxA